MAKNPAYPLYAQDFDMDTAAWENEDVGVYIRLLNYQWINKSIPNDTRAKARIVRCGHKKFQKSWKKISKKFSCCDQINLEIIINPKMEEIRNEKDNYLKGQKEAGIRGAKKRWGKDRVANGQPIATPMANGCPSSSSSFSFKDIKPFILKNDSKYVPEKDYLYELSTLYPLVNLESEFKKIAGWCLSNPAKRKTKVGAKKFINSWIASAQDRLSKEIPPEQIPLEQRTDITRAPKGYFDD